MALDNAVPAWMHQFSYRIAPGQFSSAVDLRPLQIAFVQGINFVAALWFTGRRKYSLDESGRGCGSQ
jgi:hypothetical protein